MRRYPLCIGLQSFFGVKKIKKTNKREESVSHLRLMHLLSNASGLQLKNKKKIKKNIMQYCNALQEVQPPNAVSSIASRVTVK